jgi:S-formylglutathione hydrolase FrmB
MCERLVWRRLYVTLAAVIALAAFGAALPSQTPPLDSLRSALAAARARAVADYSHIAAQTGSADQLVARLDSDETELALAGGADASMIDQLNVRITLDVSLVDRLTSDANHPALHTPGEAIVDLVRSSEDGTLQPLAIYIPSSYARERFAPLLLMLHGEQETETAVVSSPALRRLADASGVIIAAPWARGDAPVNATTVRDVDDAVSFMRSDLRVDDRRIYLGGFSTGAIDTFMIAPAHPSTWAGVLSIAGSLTNDDKQKFVDAMSKKPVYLVTGSDDPSLNVNYVRGAYSYLMSAGFDAHYYEQPGGLHSIESLQPALQRAWSDMLAASHVGMPELESPTPRPVPSLRV